MPKTSGRRLLLVEDDSTTSKALAAILRRRGWDVSVAPTVSDALSLLKNAPDWIVLDLMLPDGSGEQVLGAVRQQNLTARIVVTTGCHDDYRLDALSSLRPQAVMHKPIDLALLCRTLEAGAEDVARPMSGDAGN